jgi:hypothetical protein
MAVGSPRANAAGGSGTFFVASSRFLSAAPEALKGRATSKAEASAPTEQCKARRRASSTLYRFFSHGIMARARIFSVMVLACWSSLIKVPRLSGLGWWRLPG